MVENRKSYSRSKEDAGRGFAVWKRKAGKTLPASIVSELMESLRQSIERGDEPPVGRTAKPLAGLKARSGSRTFRAKLRIERNARASGRWSSTRTGRRTSAGT